LTSEILRLSVPRRKISGDSSNLSNPFRGKTPSLIYCATPSDPLLETSRTVSRLARRYLLPSSQLYILFSTIQYRYKLVGGSVEALCEWNARAAEEVRHQQLAFSWRMLALLCSQTDIGAIRPSFYSGRGAGPNGYPMMLIQGGKCISLFG